MNDIKEIKKERLKKKVKKIIKNTYAFMFLRAIKVVLDKSYFPEMERKNIFIRYIDNLKWIFKYHRVNYSYNLFGLDIKNFRKQDDYVDIKYIKRERLKEHHKYDAQASHRDENITIRYSILADNKHLFYSYMDSISKNLVPKTYMVVNKNKVVTPFDSKFYNKNLKEAIGLLPNGKYIFKSCIGAMGKSISVIAKSEKGVILNNGSRQLDELIEETNLEPYLIQEYVHQHEKLSAINPETVNTLRIISTRWNEDTHILAAMLRVGSESSQLVDNASIGGSFVGINYNNGKLMKYGYYYNKPKETHHPISNVKYEDYQIPYWEETIDLITKLHPILYGFSTIGWDIAITEKGPIIIEINWNYSVKGIQIASGGFRKRWEELKKK